MTVSQTAFYESDYDNLDEMLLRASEHPFVVRVDFNTRYRVLRDQLIPGRLVNLQALLAVGGTYDPVVNQTMKDIRNLYKRAEKEFMAVANDIDCSTQTLRAMQSIYRCRKYQLMMLTQTYFGEVIRILSEYEPTEISEI